MREFKCSSRGNNTPHLPLPVGCSSANVQHRGKRHPQRNRYQSKRPQQQKGRFIADPLRDPAAKSRTEGGAHALNGNHGALPEIDLACAAE